VKRAILLIIVGAAIGGAAVFILKREGSEANEKPGEKPGGEESQKASVTRDADGNVVVQVTADAQKNAGIAAAKPAPAESETELKAYGRVPDPAPLAGMMTDLATARAAYVASSNELVRLKTLEGQGNASPRAMQTAEAAALRDQQAVQSAQDHLVLAWGRSVAAKDDLPAFIQSLLSLNSALVRLDLTLGEVAESAPSGARVVTLSGKSIDAEFLDAAPAVDPLVQGRGFFFLIPTNTVHLLAGEAVTGYLKLAGAPQAGVIVPREAVIRTAGKGWVYVLNTNGASFTRKEIALDHPVETGWFITQGVTASDQIVVTGAQTLLSEELKSSMSAD
jgi:hypothetical protein